MSVAYGLATDPPPRRSEPHEARWELVERRERFAREHPEIIVKPRRDHGRLFFDVSAPGFAATGYDDALTMLDDLQKRYGGRSGRSGDLGPDAPRRR